MTGRVISGAQIMVHQADSSSQASIYTDRSGLSLKTQPLVSARDGSYKFYVEPGYYDIYISAVGYGRDTLFAVPIGVAPGYGEYVKVQRGDWGVDSLRVKPSSTPPDTTGNAGILWFDESAGVLKFYDGSAWKVIS